jgi:rhodanese-related sulfurtransferase
VFRCIQRWRFRRWLARVRLTPQQLEAAMRTESPPVILDARPDEALVEEAQRIPGALRLDPSSQANIDAALPAKNRVVYCVCPDDATAMRITQHMRRKGFTRIRALKGDIDAWARRGYSLDALSSGPNGPNRTARVKALRAATGGAVTLRGVAPRKGAPGGGPAPIDEPPTPDAPPH